MSAKKRRVASSSSSSSEEENYFEEDENAVEEEEEEEEEEERKQPPSKQPSPKTKLDSTPVKPEINNTPPSSAYIELPSFLTNFKSIPLPNGQAVQLIGNYLIELNKPVNLSSIVVKFKETLTKTQVEKSISTLVSNNIVLTSEDSKQALYWINQSLLEEINLKNSIDFTKVNEWYTKTSEILKQKEELKVQLENEIKFLMTAPSDLELDDLIVKEITTIAQLKPRVEECEQVRIQAELNGQSPIELQTLLINEKKKELLFYRKEWKGRKGLCMEFVDKVCESKGLKGSSRKELLEKIGIETDESLGVKLLRGVDL